MRTLRNVAALVALSFGLQLYSLALLAARKQFSQDLNVEVALDSADIVITDTWFLPADLAYSFHAKPIFVARSESERRRLDCADKGIEIVIGFAPQDSVSHQIQYALVIKIAYVQL